MGAINLLDSVLLSKIPQGNDVLVVYVSDFVTLLTSDTFVDVDATISASEALNARGITTAVIGYGDFGVDLMAGLSSSEEFIISITLEYLHQLRLSRNFLLHSKLFGQYCGLWIRCIWNMAFEMPDHKDF